MDTYFEITPVSLQSRFSCFFSHIDIFGIPWILQKQKLKKKSRRRFFKLQPAGVSLNSNYDHNETSKFLTRNIPNMLTTHSEISLDLSRYTCTPNQVFFSNMKKRSENKITKHNNCRNSLTVTQHEQLFLPNLYLSIIHV